MKKLLIIGALGFAGFMVYKAINKTDDGTGTATDNNNAQLSEIDEVLQKWNGWLITDKDGYWMVVKNGKLYSPTDDAGFFAWQNSNPGKTNPTRLDISVWNPYSADYFGGTFDATRP